MRRIEIIPFKNFKEKVRLIKEFDGKEMVQAYKDYIVVDYKEDARC